MQHDRAIVWFRRDLRLTDHTALQEALDQAREVVLVFIVSDWSGAHPWTGEKRQAFLAGSLASLQSNIESRGGQLVIRAGSQHDTLLALAEETKATAIFCHRSPDPDGIAIEAKIEESCTDLNLAFHALQDHALHERGEVLTNEGKPYRVFTPYFRRWETLAKRPPLPAPKSLPCASDIPSLPCPQPEHWGFTFAVEDLEQEPGERAARERMKQALTPDGVVSRYDRDRDTPSGQTTSRLSQDLRFGLLSIREVYQRAEAGRNSAASPAHQQHWETFAKELAWREFYMQILWHFPEVLEHEFNPDFRGFAWISDPEAPDFARWKEGQTGFPIVDAGMRQLNKTGFMHNRVRMIVSMFLTKDLRIDWRLGEKYFMQQLVDGEIASNNGGWQWSAGTGADAAPYFRIQNPWTQTKRFDPKGDYIRHWVPELAEVPAKALFTAPADQQTIALGYPAPIVDHSEERKRNPRCLRGT